MSLPLSTDVHNRLVNFIRYLETQSFIEPSNDRIVNTLKNLLHDITGVWYSNNDISLRTVETLLKGALWVCDHLPVASPCSPCPPSPPTYDEVNVEITLDRFFQVQIDDANTSIETLILPYWVSDVTAGFAESLVIYDTPNLVSVDLPVLIGNPNITLLNVETCPVLTTLNIPFFHFGIGQWCMDVTNNPSLTTVDVSGSAWDVHPLSAWQPPACNMTGCALSEDSVNALLIRADLMKNPANPGSINISGGTSAAPTGAGAAAKASLIAAGWAVTTN